MKEMVKFGFVLGIICTVAAGLLSGVNVLTKPKILAQAQAEEDSGLKSVFPEAASFEAIKDKDLVIYYKAKDNNEKFIGVVFKASGKGYSSTIETFVGMLKDGRILAIKVLSQNETPGLGSRVAEEGFTDRFKGVTDLSDVQAITGATISSRAVIEAVEKKAEIIKDLVKNEK
jgi:electron transport complex protein RnfG